MAHRSGHSDSNTLVLESEGCSPLDCLQRTVGQPARENVLIITFTETAADIESWLSANLDTAPANVGIISAGEQRHATGYSATPVENDGFTVSTIESSDLTGLDIALTEYLSMWADTDNTTKVCFYSLIPLETVGISSDTIYRFLRTVTQKVSSADASARYHVNPAALSEGAVARLKPLFDSVET